MSITQAALILLLLGVVAPVGLRALIRSEEDDGLLAGGALVALSIVMVAWIVASR